ncbi:MAG: hypothetical protein P4L22_06480 [Candidatus Babeliales bacterium]|nr:hypothetical protein [Candidatus Babeliales bacterium]
MKVKFFLLLTITFSYHNFMACADMNPAQASYSYFINKEGFFEFAPGKPLANNQKITHPIIMVSNYINNAIELILPSEDDKILQPKFNGLGKFLTFLDEATILKVLKSYKEYLESQYIGDNKVIYEKMGLIKIWGTITPVVIDIDSAIKSLIANLAFFKKVEHYINSNCSNRKHFISQNYSVIMEEYKSLTQQLTKNIANLKKILKALMDERERIKLALKIEEPKQTWGEFFSSNTPDSCKLQ